MKVKIRKHEQLLIALFGLMTIINYTLQQLGFIPVYISGFNEYLKSHPNVHFNYSAYLLLPRIGVVLLFMFSYFWLNKITIPQIRRNTNGSFFIYAWVLIQVLLLAYFLAIGVNFATYYARPAWNNYADFRIFALLGYNEYPLTDLWAGFDRALICLAAYGIFATLRELVIHRIENSGSKSNYRVLIANQISSSLCIFLLFPALVLSLNLIKDDANYGAYFVFIPSAIIIYITNIYWLFPRLLNTSNNIVRLILTLSICTFLCSFPFMGFLFHLGININVWPINWSIQLLLVTPITWMLYQQKKDKILELRGTKIALSKTTADLQFLRSQINPHFLFNVLNTLYGTALIDGSKRTANGIQMLGDMMRFMLDDNHLDFIPLSNEISYLKNYIALQKLRIQDSEEIDISEEFTIDNYDHEIIPMLLIPFVENAFKHGIDLNKKSWINISLSCDGKRITLNVRNSLHKVDANDPERKHAGIGLKNVTERLMMFYEGQHELNHSSTEKEFIIKLVIDTKAPKS
ncbi:sensor histidine kinase [Pedobacter jejuensis]|uniref:Histidine kinase n=1 Tax=Pedobacter jejuensis TaxID=1268550 RepID=A0A3N0C1H4_9SPHI|nr:histidine kinase [Pedobacter jejuensis]RNL55914.1 histidine kinase [Pedobacter jejuensis]